MPNLVVLGQTLRAYVWSVGRKWPFASSPSKSLKVIVTDNNRSATYDIQLIIHSNHGPISFRFQDKWWFLVEKRKFSHTQCIKCPRTGVPIGINDAVTNNQDAPLWSKSLTCSFVYTQHMNGPWTDRIGKTISDFNNSVRPFCVDYNLNVQLRTLENVIG